MAPNDFFAAVAALTFGKRLPTAVYLIDLCQERLPWELRTVCAELRMRIGIGPEFNLLKFHTDRPKISFLSYPEFFNEPHPALHSAIVIDLVSGKVRRDEYLGRTNPPILHRKETFLPSDHPDYVRFSELTHAEEAAGILEDSERIGFKLNWERILAGKSLGFSGHRLVERRSAAGPGKVRARPFPKVERHRTALVRGRVSKPVRLMLDFGQLRRGEVFFDYGCGLGGDFNAVKQLGFASEGWDPVHAPQNARNGGDVVNLGFVLNVIEDPAERVEVLLQAWSLARRLLIVSTLVRGNENYADFRCCSDGIITSRNTFQKYFEPAELQALIEDSTKAEAVPVAMGIYFVFRRVEDLQDFLSSRTRRFIDWESLSRRLGLFKALHTRRDPYDLHRELLDSFWEAVLEFGRIPRQEEYPRLNGVRTIFGSLPKAMAFFEERFGQQTLDSARLRRREDLLVYVAASRLRQRVPFAHLSLRLQRDFRSFFGSYPEAERHATDAMFAAGDVGELEIAVQQLGFGWFDSAERHFTVHRTLLDDLPLVLRVFVECGARLFGDPREADLIKFHLRSRKLTFLHYTGFDAEPFPTLRLRIKIDLPRMFVSVFDHTTGPDRQLLFFKERFLPSTYPPSAGATRSCAP
jgi:DNA phosphorothioation-associated putative methyltransferase